MKWITGSVLNDQLSCEIFCPIKKKKYLCTVLINITRYNLKYTNVKNSENNQWYIYTFTEGTYDAVRLYYPIQLDDTYKTDGQKVLFSGTYGATDYVAGTPAGTELFIIKLTSISKR